MKCLSNIIMENIIKNLHLLILPSTLWGVHIDPKYEYLGILHMNVPSSAIFYVDKAVLLSCEDNQLKPTIFLNNSLADIPKLNAYINSIADLSEILHTLQEVRFCGNFYNTESYSKCLKFIFTDAKYCTSCQRQDDLELAGFSDYEVQCRHEEYSYEEPNAEFPNIQRDFLSKNSPVLLNTTISSTFKQPSDNRCENNKELLDNLNQNQENRGIRDIYKHKDGFSEIDSVTNTKDELASDKDKCSLCNICGKTFRQGYRIEEHMLTHTSEKPFECQICKKTFAKNYNLKMHEHIHSGERPFICSKCGKTYTTKSNLATHMMSAHNDQKRHVCETCDMSFVHPRHLRIHMRKHTGEKPFRCLTCGKVFAKKIHLTVHIRTHTGEKPFVCSVCGKGFTTSGNLNAHTRIHHKTFDVT